MKRLLLVFALSVFLVSCQTAQVSVPLDTQVASTYDNSEFGFSIGVPAGWTYEEGAYGTIVTLMSFMEDADDMFGENINVTTEEVPVGMTSLQYFNASTVALKAYLAGFKVHKKGTAIIDGATAHWLIYSFALDDFKVKGKVFMLTK
ncbi:MAG: hypothetical protein KAR06_00800, partial [Deltaproteobacteria bacterium]|nr:hypothetical protein [Deltaproteobacteria bacterium]